MNVTYNSGQRTILECAIQESIIECIQFQEPQINNYRYFNIKNKKKIGSEMVEISFKYHQ